MTRRWHHGSPFRTFWFCSDNDPYCFLDRFIHHIAVAVWHSYSYSVTRHCNYLRIMLTAPPKRSNGFEVSHYRELTYGKLGFNLDPPKKNCQRSPFFGVLAPHVKGINLFTSLCFLPSFLARLCHLCAFSCHGNFFTPWKINGWNLQPSPIWKGKWSSKPCGT